VVEKLLDTPTVADVAGKSGASYQVEVEGVLGLRKPRRPARHGCHGRRRFSAFRPLIVAFIVRPDGTFVGG
jgi:hypothetical protein